MNRASRWVDNNLRRANKRFWRIESAIPEKGSKPFGVARTQMRRPYRSASAGFNRRFNAVLERLAVWEDRLPHPRARWQKVKGASTFRGRATGGAQVVAIGSSRLLGFAGILVAYFATFGVAGAYHAAIGLTYLAARLTVRAAEIAVLGTPLLTVWAAQLLTGVAAGITIAALESPAFSVRVAKRVANFSVSVGNFVSRLAGAPPRWIRRGMRWLVKGQEGVAPATTSTTAVETAISRPVAAPQPEMAEADVSRGVIGNPVNSVRRRNVAARPVAGAKVTPVMTPPAKTETSGVDL